MNINNIVAYILSFFLYPYQLLTNWNIFKRFILTILFIVILYFGFGYIYCKLFKIAYIKYLESTIFPIIGMILLIIQGIIYIFFIPYYIYVVVIDTFQHALQVLSVLYKWVYNLIDTTINMEDYLLDNSI